MGLSWEEEREGGDSTTRLENKDGKQRLKFPATKNSAKCCCHLVDALQGAGYSLPAQQADSARTPARWPCLTRRGSVFIAHSALSLHFLLLQPLLSSFIACIAPCLQLLFCMRGLVRDALIADRAAVAAVVFGLPASVVLLTDLLYCWA